MQSVGTEAMLTLVYGRTTPIYKPGEILSGDIVINSTTQCKILSKFYLVFTFKVLITIHRLTRSNDKQKHNCNKIK